MTEAERSEHYRQALEDIKWMSPRAGLHEGGESYAALTKRMQDRAREALKGAETIDTRCPAIAHISTGVYRCVYESGHRREGVGPPQHYYDYDRAFAGDEVGMFKDAPSARPRPLPAPEAT